MKHKLGFLFLGLIITSLAFTQVSKTFTSKPPITPDVFEKWPAISTARISNNGMRIVYWINEPADKKTSLYLYTIATNQHEKLDSLPDEFKEKAANPERSLVFSQEKTEKGRVTEKGVDVWSYTDSKLQSQQLKDLNKEEQEYPFSITDNYALIVLSKGTDNEWNWNKTSLKTTYLYSFKDRSRKIINDVVGCSFHDIYASYWIMPGEKFVVYYDPKKKNYFSYEISTGNKKNISSSIKTTWTSYVKRDVPMAPNMAIGFAGAIENDEAVLVYDQCDIWQLDPAGKKPPINLTNGYGRAHNIELRLALDNKKLFQKNESVILSGFNRINKNDGFYKIKIDESKTPQLLYVGPYIFRGTWEDDNNAPIAPIKAKDAEVYLVRRMSAEESPNYFWTTDFKTFNRITDVHPEKNHNWITSELITWKLPDGSTSQGILYKPENFDPKKKYPVIFNYYENSSEGLHGFLIPETSHANLDIPYYVSNGYLVFKPDMHYKIGHPGQSVVNTVVSAANYLSKLPFVDAKHMGIQGHSRGGWETNFILTHTNIFAAGMSSAGMCDYVSLYNRIRSLSSGISGQTAFEMSYQRIGATLWQRPDLYIENSPIFNADKVKTPVLMMSNKDDDDVPFEQGVEFFTALRRLGKRAWMLQYDGQRHVIFDKAAEDRSVRMKQFFDHYLKDSACPRWMLYGVPAAEKGNPDALKLVYEKDKNGKWLTPKEGGLLTEEEKKKVEALKRRKPVTITID